MADEHETESKAWAIEAAAAEAASRAAEEMHRPPVVPMERVVGREDIERGERAGRKARQNRCGHRFLPRNLMRQGSPLPPSEARFTEFQETRKENLVNIYCACEGA